MSRSLKNQLTFAINQNFSEGTDKHSIKAENKDMSENVYSYNEKYRLSDVMNNFENYLKDNEIKIKEVSQIQTKHIQSFLNDKSTSCTQNTINSYTNSFYKIQNVLNATFKTCNLTWRDTLVIPGAISKSSQTRGADSVISRADYDKLIDYAKENYSQSGACIILQNEFGVRVEEITRIKLDNINLERQEITFQCKGGKNLTRAFSLATKQHLEKVLEHKHDTKGYRLFSINGSSLNKYLLRTQDTFGMERHSNHDIRRLIAQEKYDSYRNAGLNPKEALSATSIWLNHVSPRDEMITKSYIHIH